MNANGKNIEELTRIEAYLLSEKAGHPSHMHDYFWTQAQALVRHRVAIVEEAVKALAKPAKAKPATAKTSGAKKPVAQLLLDEKPAPARTKAKAVTPAANKAPAKTGKRASKAK